MNRTPNALQKLLHRFLMLRPVSAFLAVSLYRLDSLVLKISNGKHTVAEIVGLPMIQITTTGAKTGEARTMPLVSLFDGEKIALIGSNFGRKYQSWLVLQPQKKPKMYRLVMEGNLANLSCP